MQIPVAVGQGFLDASYQQGTFFYLKMDTASSSETFTYIYQTKLRHIPDNLNLLKPTGHVMHQPFNIQQLYVLPTLYLCVLYLSENKERLVPLTV